MLNMIMNSKYGDIHEVVGLSARTVWVENSLFLKALHILTCHPKNTVLTKNFQSAGPICLIFIKWPGNDLINVPVFNQHYQFHILRLFVTKTHSACFLWINCPCQWRSLPELQLFIVTLNRCKWRTALLTGKQKNLTVRLCFQVMH